MPAYKRIYTGTGDRGCTLLASGRRVPKHHPRIKMMAEIDMLIALVSSALNEASSVALETDQRVPIEYTVQLLRWLIRCLHWVCGLVAGAEDNKLAISKIEETVKLLEGIIDRYWQYAHARGFVLIAGSRLACQLNVSRAQCRRMENLLSELLVSSGQDESDLADPDFAELGEYLQKFFNRLADLLFAMALYYTCETTYINELPDKPPI